MKIDKKICFKCGEQILDDNTFICEKCWNDKSQIDWSDVISICFILMLIGNQLEYEPLTENEIEKLKSRSNYDENNLKNLS